MRHAREWVTGEAVDRTGVGKYVHLIRSPGDPERRPRYKGQDVAPHLTARKTPRAEWARRIAALLSDGAPRTFNRIALELTEKTADTMMETPLDAALWDLVREERLEHTTHAPILFRLREETST